MSAGRTSEGGGFSRRLRRLTRRSERGEASVLRGLRNRLVMGFLVAFPLVVTVFFARFVFGLLDHWFRPISNRLFGFTVHGAGMLLALVGLYLLGVFATNMFGSRLLGVFERFVSRLPLLSPIYKGARQITEAIQVRGTRDFRKVVMVAFPHPGVRSIGFVTREFSTPTAFGTEPSYLVFVPTTPNPTSGFLVAVPVRSAEVLTIDVEEGVKLVISGGLLTPDALLRSSAAPPEMPPESEQAGEEPGLPPV